MLSSALTLDSFSRVLRRSHRIDDPNFDAAAESSYVTVNDRTLTKHGTKYNPKV